MWDAIRRFDLEYCDLPTMIWNVSFILRVLTLNVDSRHTKRIPIICYILTVLCAASYYYVYLVSILWFLFVRSPQTGDLLTSMMVTSLGVCSEIGTSKLIFMYSSVISIAVGFVFLIVGIIAALLGGIENTFQDIVFSLSQVAMDCWTGQRLIDVSVMFAQAVYECKWENFDQQNMKIVLVMLQNSQRTLTLSAGGMTTLSFSCLMSILRSIYSAYTTLRSMIKKPD